VHNLELRGAGVPWQLQHVNFLRQKKKSDFVCEKANNLFASSCNYVCKRYGHKSYDVIKSLSVDPNPELTGKKAERGGEERKHEAGI
jgi:hypothetical protein